MLESRKEKFVHAIKDFRQIHSEGRIDTDLDDIYLTASKSLLLLLYSSRNNKLPNSISKIPCTHVHLSFLTLIVNGPWFKK
ncbi:hypothetical protein Leryth_016581 [Lithospermum erythrorhizon]|nr:hypothetical protein Leryth_016581 [Lithospermum erythrorhizon]